METMINEFSSKYPQTANYATLFSKMNLPIETSLWVSLNTSILMSKLKNGGFSKYRRGAGDLPDNVIDMFGRTYLQNIEKAINNCVSMFGTGKEVYDRVTKIKILEPNLFMETLVKQYCN
jgi:hypothetical protein